MSARVVRDDEGQSGIDAERFAFFSAELKRLRGMVMELAGRMAGRGMVATTEQPYCVPLVRPLTVTGDAVPVPVFAVPPPVGVHVAV